MLGKNKTICIAGKNYCAIKVLDFVLKNYKNYEICALPNSSDSGVDGWQKSFRKFAKYKNIKIVNLSSIYKKKIFYLFSLEYEKILDIKKFKSNNLFNFHFSLLPKYRGCHTNFYQILKGEKKTGVTLHIIDKGIDTGNIIDKISFNIPINQTAYDNYLKYLKKSVILFKKNIDRILKNEYFSKKQNLKNGSYFSRKSVKYKKLLHINLIKNNLMFHNKIRSLIFEPYQLPVYNGKKIKKSVYSDNKIKLLYLK